MKLKDIPGVMLEKKEMQGKCETWESDGYSKYYNQAITAQGEVEVELDREKARVISQAYCAERNKHKIVDVDLMEDIITILSDNLSSILRRTSND